MPKNQDQARCSTLGAAPIPHTDRSTLIRSPLQPTVTPELEQRSGLKSSFRVVDRPATLSPPELQGGCCLERPACFVVSRHGAGTDVIDPAMEGKIAFFQPSRNRGM